jgi:protein required for attachment to host cells
MNTTWILVANTAQASIHALGSRWDDLDCVAQYSANGNTHDLFAGMLAEQLLRGRENHSYDDLVLVAPHAMLGELHQAIDETTRACVSNEFDNNVCQLSSEELSKYLCDALNS